VAPSIRIKLALTSPTSGGRSVGIVRSLTQTTELVCLVLSLGGDIIFNIVHGSPVRCTNSPHEEELPFLFVCVYHFLRGTFERDRVESSEEYVLHRSSLDIPVRNFWQQKNFSLSLQE
jgi:hypothetical protein